MLKFGKNVKKKKKNHEPNEMVAIHDGSNCKSYSVKTQRMSDLGLT